MLMDNRGNDRGFAECYINMLSRRDQGVRIMRKKLVDIGTKKLEAAFHGAGTPAVVIETGMGCSWHDWCSIISEISKRTTVMTYHRAGYGESTLGEGQRSTRQIAEDLNKLLEKEGVNSPIVLVGHSFGGLCVQHFASLFPEKVSGMVLVDSNSMDEQEMDELREKLPSFSRAFPKKDIVEKWRELSLKSEAELETLLSPKLLPEQTAFEEEVQKCILKFQTNPKMYSAMASELELMAQSGQEMKKCFKTLQVPLKVLGRDRNLAVQWNVDMGIPQAEAVELEDLWHDLVSKEARNSTKGQFMEVKDSKHSIYRTNPEVVVKAMNDVMEEEER